MNTVCVSFFDTIVSYLVGSGKPGYNIRAHERKRRSTAEAATDMMRCAPRIGVYHEVVRMEW